MVLIQRDQEATEGTDASTYTFADDQTYAIIRDVENKIVVGIDHHQNKHQHPKTMSAEIGTWTKKKGTLFKKGRGLDWHRRNTAETIKAWALEQIPLTGRVTLKKKPLSDGYIYDASVQPDEGLAIVTYHCNPLQNE